MCNVMNGEELTWSAKNNVEVKTVNTDGWVVFDSKINVFLDTKAKVACVTEVFFPQFIFTNFQSSLKDFFSLGSSNSAVNCNLFITANTKGAHSISSFRKYRLLTCQLFQNLKQNKTLIPHFHLLQYQITLAALVSLSPDSPTQIFRHSLRIRNSRITFLVLSFLTSCYNRKIRCYINITQMK